MNVDRELRTQTHTNRYDSFGTITTDQQPTRRKLLTTIAAGTATLAGCSVISAGSTNSTLRLGTLYPPISLDPIVLETIGSAQIAERIFNGLYTYNETTRIVPQIANGEPKIRDDGHVYEVTIRKDAQFQNGNSVTPEDVKYSFEAPVVEKSPTAGDIEMVHSIKSIGSRTVQFTLEYPYPAFKYALTRPIVPKSVRKSKGEKFGEKPIGAGPFKLTSFSPETKAELTRWDDYWGEPLPAIKNITVAYIESPVTRLTSLIVGRSDLVEPVPSKLWNQFERQNGISIAATTGFMSCYVGFNCNEGPTTKRKIREAVDYCFDMDEAVRKFVGQSGQRQYSPLPPQVAKQWNMPLEHWKTVAHSKNIEKAKKLFENAGVSSWKPKILIPKDPTLHAIALSIVGGLREAGFTQATVSTATGKEFGKQHVSGIPNTYALYIDRWAGTPDPDSYLYPLLHENQEGTTNGTFYQNNRVMTQIMTARKTNNRKKRRQLYEAAITAVLDDRVVLPSFSRKNSFGVKSRVKNFHAHPIVGVNPQFVGKEYRVSIK